MQAPMDRTFENVKLHFLDEVHRFHIEDVLFLPIARCSAPFGPARDS